MKNFFEILLKQSKVIISIYIFFGIILGLYSFNNLKINTSTDSLINNKLDFKINHKNLKESFDVLNNNILIRLKSDNETIGSNISQDIINKLNAHQAISFVYSPNFDEVFKKNFFLFLNENEKEKLIKKLYQYQPFLSQINNSDSKLSGFNDLLELNLKNDSPNTNKELESVFEVFSDSLSEKNFVNWKNIFSSGPNEFFIIFGLKDEFISEGRLNEIYKFLKDLKKFEKRDVSIGFTGGLIIDYEEVASVSDGAMISGILSFILVGIILWVLFKKLLPIFILLSTILLGLLITVGFTTLIIGSLNLISVAFAVLFIGLSVDYGIQVYSRITENITKNNKIEKINSIFKTLFIVSIPSIIGFLSFVPTDYVGLSELGIISAIGLIVGLILNTSFLPCLINLTANKKKIKFFNLDSTKFLNFLENKRSVNMVKFLFLSVCFFSLINYESINFDSDALNLKDQNLESVKLAKEVIESNPTSDYVASIILNKSEIEQFNGSHPIFSDENIKSFFSYNNIFDQYESDDLNYIKFLLSYNNTPTKIKKSSELPRFKNLLYQFSDENSSSNQNSNYLLQNIARLEKEGVSSTQIEALLFNKFNDLIFLIQTLGLVPKNLHEIVPTNFINRYVSKSGEFRVEIFPSKDLSKPENLKKFVYVVENYFPKATGMPIVQLKAGKVVVESFLKALIISSIFLIVFLLFIFKKKSNVLFCLLTLLSGFIMTIFFMIILKINFNFANMISLPLLFSLGISYPIYFLKRFEQLGDIHSVYISNTPSAILFSGLTTLCSFSTLSISNHAGTSSMGILLFISLFNTLLSCLILLPIFMKSIKFK